MEFMNKMTVWIFKGIQRYPGFSSGVFLSVESAERWIQRHKLDGTLTEYAIETGTYDWAIEQGYFVPTINEHYQSSFIANFSSASQLHYHYEKGERISE